MLRKSGMTSGSPSINEVPEKPTCSNCSSTKLLIFVLFVLYTVCQVQILVNRQSSAVDIENILSGIQQASERIADIELSLIKVESTLDFLQDGFGRKTTVHMRTKRQSVTSVRQEMRQIKRYLKQLQRRIQCATSDNGTDGRGRSCLASEGGKIGYLKDKRKGEKTNSSGNPTQKSKNNKDNTERNGDTSTTEAWSQTGPRNTKRRSAVFTIWGSTKCPDIHGDEVKNVYSGKVATLHSRSNPRVGSEYLCIPHRLKNAYKSSSSGLFLSPVKYGANMSIFRTVEPDLCKPWCEKWKQKIPEMFRTLDYFQVPCSVCIHEKRTTTLITPGREMCHSGWSKEYLGFLMTHHYGEAAHHICVTADAEGVPGSNTTGTQGPRLQPVAYNCDGPNCPTTLDSSSSKPKALYCVVCTI